MLQYTLAKNRVPTLLLTRKNSRIFPRLSMTVGTLSYAKEQVVVVTCLKYVADVTRARQNSLGTRQADIINNIHIYVVH